MTFNQPPLQPVVVQDGVVRLFQTPAKVHLWPSNFFVQPLYIMGMTLPSIEHYYQAMKALKREDREKILMCDTPGQAKRLGRTVDCRPDWEQIKNTVMLTALHEKFAPGTICAEALLASGDVLFIEGNTWHDNVWGDCTCGRGACSQSGENRLGRMLVRQRDILRGCAAA